MASRARVTLAAAGGSSRPGAYVIRTTTRRRAWVAPSAHPSGARPPELPSAAVPDHVAIIMDGNGRWAKQRGLPRTEGHARGEAALFDVIEGAIELGIGN